MFSLGTCWVCHGGRCFAAVWLEKRLPWWLPGISPGPKGLKMREIETDATVAANEWEQDRSPWRLTVGRLAHREKSIVTYKGGRPNLNHGKLGGVLFPYLQHSRKQANTLKVGSNVKYAPQCPAPSHELRWQSKKGHRNCRSPISF